MAFALHWVFPDWGTAITGVGGLFFLTAYLLDKFNGQELKNKLLNTGKFGVAGFAGVLWAAYLEYVAENESQMAGRPFNYDRIWLPVVWLTVFFVTIILADWFNFGLHEWGHSTSSVVDWVALKLFKGAKDIVVQARERVTAFIVSVMIVIWLLVACAPDTVLQATLNHEATAMALTATASPVILRTNGSQTPGVTPTAQPSQVTVTPGVTVTAPRVTPSPTESGIIEVTPLGGGTGIIVLGDINGPPPPPGVWTFVPGHYASNRDWNVRSCADVTCGIVGSLSAGVRIPTYGFVLDVGNAAWLCSDPKAHTDERGAQICGAVFLARMPDGAWLGIYEVN